MKEILLSHQKRYPHMQAQDAVKLLYQSEFGSGHMIADPEKSLARLRDEWKLSADRRGDTPVLEEIGDGLSRIDLRALDEGLSASTLNRIFVLTAGRKTGDISRFERKLDELRQCCGQGETPFSLDELDSYLSEYKRQGYPAVSHSEVYRRLYHPAYRVADDHYARYFTAFLEIDRVMAGRKDTVLAAIDGMCGSGKSTMGHALQEVYSCRLFHMDDYFLRPEQRTAERYAQPGGNIDYERFGEEILNHVGGREGLAYRPFDCKTFALGQAVRTQWSRLNLAEGSYSQHPYFGDVYDLRFFCRISAGEQRRRIRERNGEEMLEKFENMWIPMENRYFETFKIRENSILIQGEP